MHEFFQHFRSVEWVLSVVVVGLLIGIAANYSKVLIDRTYGGLTTRWRNSTKKRQAAREALTDDWAAGMRDDEAFTTYIIVGTATAGVRQSVANLLAFLMLTLSFGCAAYPRFGLKGGVVVGLVGSTVFAGIGLYESDRHERHIDALVKWDSLRSVDANRNGQAIGEGSGNGTNDTPSA